MAAKKISAKDILNKALELAEASSWEAVRLHDVAHALDITLTDIHKYYREKEELADAWFDQADQQAIDLAAKPEFIRLSKHRRVHRLIMTWLGAMAAHRKVTRQMICAKLEPGHLHMHVRALLRVSRTVQWIREAAHLKDSFFRRALAETALTTIFLMTLAKWLYDNSKDSTRTSHFLDQCLSDTESFKLLLNDWLIQPCKHSCRHLMKKT